MFTRVEIMGILGIRDAGKFCSRNSGYREMTEDRKMTEDRETTDDPELNAKKNW